MRFAKAYFLAWFDLAKILSPVWISVWIFLGLSSWINLYVVYLISAAAIGGVISEARENSA